MLKPENCVFSALEITEKGLRSFREAKKLAVEHLPRSKAANGRTLLARLITGTNAYVLR